MTRECNLQPEEQIVLEQIQKGGGKRGDTNGTFFKQQKES